jgi:hypothetical protein
MNKRHAKPTSAQLLSRIYRQQIALRAEVALLQSGQRLFSERMESMHEELHRNDCLTHRRMEALTDLVQILTDSHTGTYATVVDHCARLLREKETLMSMIDRERALNGHVWKNPMLPSVTCAFASTHRAGLRCAVCEGGI